MNSSFLTPLISYSPNETLSSTSASSSSSSVSSSSSEIDQIEDEFWPLHVRVLLTILFSSLALIGVIGNILVITVVLKVRGMVNILMIFGYLFALCKLFLSDCSNFIFFYYRCYLLLLLSLNTLIAVKEKLNTQKKTEKSFWKDCTNIKNENLWIKQNKKNWKRTIIKLS